MELKCVQTLRNSKVYVHATTLRSQNAEQHRENGWLRCSRRPLASRHLPLASQELCIVIGLCNLPFDSPFTVRCTHLPIPGPRFLARHPNPADDGAAASFIRLVIMTSCHQCPASRRYRRLDCHLCPASRRWRRLDGGWSMHRHR